MYISGFWAVVLFLLVMGTIHYATQPRKREKPTPRFDPEAERKHEATREAWRKILAENRPLNDREQTAYFSFVSLDAAIKKSVAGGRGNVYSFREVLDACEEQRKQIARANELLSQLDDACARCDQEERLTGRKDGHSRASTLAMAAEIETALRQAGDINRYRWFHEKFANWRDLPLAGDSEATPRLSRH